MGDKTYEEVTQSLETQYSSLDPALVRAILSEYDHTDPEQLRTLHAILENLRVEAVVDDSSSFDPSGTSGGDPPIRSSPLQDSVNGSEHHTEGGFTTSSDTDLTKLSFELNLTTLSNSEHGTSSATSYDAPGPETRTAEKHLLELFPSQTDSTIAYILRKCNGSFDRAVDILLNHVYFDEPAEGEEKISFKGVDAFGEGTNPQRRRRKGKQKFTNRISSSDDAWSSQESFATDSAPSNHWKTAAKDIDFLATRTSASTKTVQSLYNEHGASVPATILAIIQRSTETRTAATSDDDPVEELNIATLASEFPSVSLQTVAGLIRVAAPSTSHAHELAKALTAPSTRPTDPMPSTGGKLVPHYAPLHIDEGPATMAHSVTGSTPLSAAGLASLRSNAFSSASKYHRKAGSDRLFGGAAAYYGQLGRDYNSEFRAASATEADALVASQSSGSMIDLHGVSVADAVRIAESSTQSWWDAVRLKEGRSNSDRVGGGFVIVTGRGTHSKDGRARIGPAVTKALMRQGWKVEVQSGELAVLGRVKK